MNTQDLVLSRATVELTAAAKADSPARVKIIAYSGGEMQPPGWGALVIDLAGVELPDRLPLLVDHDNRIDALAGSGAPTIEGGKLVIAGTLAKGTPAAEKVIALAKAGVPIAASVGMSPSRTEHVERGQKVQVNGKSFTAGREGLVIVRAARLKETSFVALGADPQAGVSSLAATSRNKRMSTDLNTDHDHDHDLTAEEREAERQDDIKALFSRYSDLQYVEPAMGAKPVKLSTFKSNAIRNGLDPRDVELALMRSSRPGTEAFDRGHPAIHVKVPLVGSADLAAQALSCAVARQFGMPEKLPFAGKDYGFVEAWGEQVAEASDSREVREMTSLHAMMDSVIRAESGSGFAGKRGSPAFLDAYVQSAKRLEAAGGAFSTLLVNNILEDAANKAMLARFALTAPTWPEIAEQHNLDNFHPKKLYRADANLGLLPLTPQGEIVHGELTDTKRTIEADTVARMIALDRRHIVNDDLGAFEEIVRGLADGATWSIESAVYTVLLANADDFFHADNANLIDNPLGLEGLEAAETAFGSHVGAGGKPIGFDPAILLVGNGRATTGRQLLAPQLLSVDANAPAVAIANPFANKFRLVKSKYIDVTAIRTPTGAAIPNQSATKWFLLSDPAVGAVIAVGLLNGSAVPTIRSDETTFNTLGMQWRAHFDYGVAQGDPQFGVMSTGDGSE